MGAKAELLCCTLIGAGLKADEPPIKAADSSDTSFIVILRRVGKCAIAIVVSGCFPQSLADVLTEKDTLHLRRYEVDT